jgi:hypothetical protein
MARSSIRRVVLGLAVVALATLALAVAPRVRRGIVQERMAAAARAFLATLDDAQRAKAALASDSPALRDWHFVPRDRPGLTLAEMNAAQKGALHDLLHVGLASQGYLKVTGAVHLESILHAIESRPGAPAAYRDPGRYAVVFFGTPGPQPWAWRFEGHHVSLHFCSVDDATSSTPFFLGANPARVPSGPDAGWRLLASEEDLGRELYLSLSATQRATALLAGDVPGVILGPGRDEGFEKPAGLLCSEMDAAQRARLERLLAQFVDDLAPELAAAEWDRIRKNGIGRIRFAWCGGTKAGEPHYWRLHGPHFVVEYDNVQNGANHVHTLWRDLENDFGGDLLRRHHERDHAK